MFRKTFNRNGLVQSMSLCVVKSYVVKYEGNNLISLSRWYTHKPTNTDLTNTTKNKDNVSHREQDQQNEPSKIVKNSQDLPRKISFEEYQKKILLNHRKHSPETTEWNKREISLKKRYGKWNPTKKLSREDMLKVKELKEQFPHYKTSDLANIFQISPEAIRRILNSNWVPNDTDIDKLSARKERQRQEQIERQQQNRKRYSKGYNHARHQENDDKRSQKKLFNPSYNYIGRKF